MNNLTVNQALDMARDCADCPVSALSNEWLSVAARLMVHGWTARVAA